MQVLLHSKAIRIKCLIQSRFDSHNKFDPPGENVFAFYDGLWKPPYLGLLNHWSPPVVLDSSGVSALGEGCIYVENPLSRLGLIVEFETTPDATPWLAICWSEECRLILCLGLSLDT